MSLYTDTLHDPYQIFPSDSDNAQRIQAMQRMFQQIKGPPGQGAGLPLQQSPQQPDPLANAGLSQSPFANIGGYGRRQMQPPRVAPTPEYNDGSPTVEGGVQGIADVIARMDRAYHPENYRDAAGKTSSYADSLLQRIAALDRYISGRPPLAQDYDPSQPAPAYPIPFRGPPTPVGRTAPVHKYMTPMEGPDTGDINPNAYGSDAPKGYYASLRRPEGTSANYNAVNPITKASGPYQFLPGTWQDIMKRAPSLGLTQAGFDNPSEHPEQHDAAIRFYTDQSIRKFKDQFKRDPGQGELYAMHLLGQGGGMNLLTHPDQAVGSLVGQAVLDANPWMKQYANLPASTLVSHLNSWFQQDNQ